MPPPCLPVISPYNIFQKQAVAISELALQRDLSAILSCCKAFCSYAIAQSSQSWALPSYPGSSPKPSCEIQVARRLQSGTDGTEVVQHSVATHGRREALPGGSTYLRLCSKPAQLVSVCSIFTLSFSRLTPLLAWEKLGLYPLPA